MEQENAISGNTPEAASPDQLIAEGKRCLAAGDANGAVECLQEACSLLASAHGQVSQELAEPYYLYGKALLELSRGNSSVLGSGIPVPDEKPSSDEEEEEEGEGEEGKGEEGEGEKEEGDGGKGTEPQAGGETATLSSGDVPVEAEPNQKSQTDEAVTSSNGEAGGDAPATNEVEEDKEEESDLQIAWEVLELARVICQKFDTDEYRLKLSDVNLLLGEVGLESDQYEQAILDMQSSLQLRQFVLEPIDRRIAEVHFSLGLAYTLNKQLDEAINAYGKSKETLLKRKAKLEDQLSSEGEDENKKTVESEIKELNDLLPDIESKIADVGEIKRLAEERAKEAGLGAGEAEGETSMGFASTSDRKGVCSPVAVSDISHLVRKRPAAVDDDCVQPSAKRPCTAVASGDSIENGGESEAEEKKREAGGDEDASTISSTACEQ